MKLMGGAAMITSAVLLSGSTSDAPDSNKRHISACFYSREGCSISMKACSAAENAYRDCMHKRQEGGCAMDMIIGGGTLLPNVQLDA